MSLQQESSNGGGSGRKNRGRPSQQKLLHGNSKNDLHGNVNNQTAMNSTMNINNTNNAKLDPSNNINNGLTTANSLDEEPNCGRVCCGRKYDPVGEMLQYDFSKEVKAGNGKEQPLPRIRQRGEYYIDSFNGESWSCSFGTNEEAGIWMNSGDQAGSVMAALVWILMLYSAVTVTSLTITEGIPPILGMIYAVLVSLALSCHAKTSLTDPGSVPKNAVPLESQRRDSTSHAMCGQCQTFKPPMSHHCRICNRCVSRMDHHCPWMNNCVGAGNLKHFLLFLIYTWTCSAYALTLFGWNYFFCADEDCTFHVVVVHLVRVMTVLCFGAFLFTSSMLMNVTYGLMTGIGTIDRLKKKATNTMSQSDEEPISLEEVFGIGGYHTWPFPIDPVFEEYDKTMGFSTPQRLAREQQFMEKKHPICKIIKGPGDVELPSCVNDFLPA